MICIIYIINITEGYIKEYIYEYIYIVGQHKIKKEQAFQRYILTEGL